jgi:transcriptional regulator with XRE-family HTH domain
MDIKKMIGVRIAEVRKKKGMTQKKLAEKMGISPTYLSSIERGKENPTLDMLIILAKSLGVDLGVIFTLPQIEDPAKRKSLINSLLNKADDDQLKLALKVLSSIIY